MPSHLWDRVVHKVTHEAMVVAGNVSSSSARVIGEGRQQDRLYNPYLSNDLSRSLGWISCTCHVWSVVTSMLLSC